MATKLVDAIEDSRARFDSPNMDKDHARAVLERVVAADPDLTMWLDTIENIYAIRVVRRWNWCAQGNYEGFEKPLPWLPQWE